MRSDDGPSSELPGVPFKELSLEWSLRVFCQLAVEALSVDHSAFVWFNGSLNEGRVVAHHPEDSFGGLVGRSIPLTGIAIEQDLLDRNEPVEISDASASQDRLGEVAPLLQEYGIASLYIVKVVAHGRPVGSFSLDRRSAGPFTVHERAVAASLATLASRVVEQAELASWLSAFGAATKEMVAPGRQAELPDVITRLARDLFHVNEAGLYERQLDESAGEERLTLLASTANRPPVSLQREDGGMAWQLIDSHRQFDATSDYSSYDHRSARFVESKPPFGAVLEVPLVWRNERVGVFYLSDVLGRVFTPFDAELLQRFADMAVLAIQRARLLSRIKQLSEESALFSGALDEVPLDSRLEAVARAATIVLNAEMCGIFRLHQSDRLVLEASVGHRADADHRGVEYLLLDAQGSGLTGAIAKRLMDAEVLVQEGGGTSVFNSAGVELRSDPAVRSTPGKEASPSGVCHSLLAVLLCVRTRNDQRFLGLVRVSNKRGANGRPSDECRFSAEDAWILELLARAAAVAIEGADLVDTIATSRARLEQTRDTVASVVVELVQGRHAEALRILVTGASVVTGASSVDLVTLIPGVPRPVLEHTTHGLPPQVTSEWLANADESVVGRLIRAGTLARAKGEMHVADNAADDELMRGPFVSRTRVVASAALRLWIKPGASTASRQLDLSHGARGQSEVCVGVLFINFDHSHRVTTSDEAIVELFGRLAAVAIHDRHIHDDTGVEIRVRNALYKAARDLASSLDLASTYQTITDQAFLVANALGRSVKFVDIAMGGPQSHAVVAASPRGQARGIVERLAAYQGTSIGLVARCLVDGKTVCANDAINDADYIEVHPETRSELVLGLRDERQNLIGALNIESPELGGFQERDVEFFELYALLASDAIRNAMRYEELRRAHQQREELRRLLLYYVRAGVEAHRYRATVAEAASLAEAARSGAGRVEESAALRDTLEEFVVKSGELTALLSPKGFEPSSWQDASLAVILEEFLAAIRPNRDFANVRVMYDPAGAAEVVVRVDAPMFRHCLEIFFRNSRQAVRGIRDGWISLHTRTTDDGRCALVIEDNGHGMSSERWASVLEGPVPPLDDKGSGMGLALARIILSAFGAEVRKLRSDSTGTAFEILVPRVSDGDVK